MNFFVLNFSSILDYQYSTAKNMLSPRFTSSGAKSNKKLSQSDPVVDCSWLFCYYSFFYFLTFDRLRKTFLKYVKFAGGCISLRKNSYMYILHVLLWTWSQTTFVGKYIKKKRWKKSLTVWFLFYLLHLPWELEILVMTALVFCATDAAETSWNLGCLSLMALACLNLFLLLIKHE